jgi:hypothetical protein
MCWYYRNEQPHQEGISPWYWAKVWETGQKMLRDREASKVSSNFSGPRRQRGWTSQKWKDRKEKSLPRMNQHSPMHSPNMLARDCNTKYI